MKITTKKVRETPVMKTKDIIYDKGKYFVWEAFKGEYYVMRGGYLGSMSDSCYDSLELAKARCDYLVSKKPL